MRASLVFVISLFFTYSSADENFRITCSDIKSIKAIGTIFVDWLSSDKTKTIDVKFYLSTLSHRKPLEIDTNDWTQLASGGFDVSKKTFIITHGYLSGGQKPWVLELKDALLDTKDGNVIMIDWSDGSGKKNYVNAAKNTVLASNRIFNFLQSLRARTRDLKGSSSEILWNHLHFIGHSLGAHVCAQTAHLLKSDGFWKIERITGLDPAKPCFSNVGVGLRIDKTDADFVDIIHTQIGEGYTDALGLTDKLGHIDFYLNGGMVQPECQGKIFGYQEMICSHKLATKYFIESIRDSQSKSCTFPVQRWNGSYLDAQIRINFLKKGLQCDNCPTMGLDAVKSKLHGIFLVLTGARQPYCKLNPFEDLQKIIPAIRRLKGIKSIFDHSKPDQSFPFVGFATDSNNPTV